MKFSIPITVLTILAITFVGVGVFSPPPNENVWVTVKLPATTFNKLALMTRNRTDSDGRPLTIVQVIEELLAERN